MEREKVRKKKNGGRYCLQYKCYTVFGKKNRNKENDMWARCFFFFFKRRSTDSRGCACCGTAARKPRGSCVKQIRHVRHRGHRGAFRSVGLPRFTGQNPGGKRSALFSHACSDGDSILKREG